MEAETEKVSEAFVVRKKSIVEIKSSDMSNGQKLQGLRLRLR